VIARYFPEFERELPRYLSRPWCEARRRVRRCGRRRQTVAAPTGPTGAVRRRTSNGVSAGVRCPALRKRRWSIADPGPIADPRSIAALRPSAAPPRTACPRRSAGPCPNADPRSGAFPHRPWLLLRL